MMIRSNFSWGLGLSFLESARASSINMVLSRLQGIHRDGGLRFPLGSNLLFFQVDKNELPGEFILSLPGFRVPHQLQSLFGQVIFGGFGLALNRRIGKFHGSHSFYPVFFSVCIGL